MAALSHITTGAFTLAALGSVTVYRPIIRTVKAHRATRCGLSRRPTRAALRYADRSGESRFESISPRTVLTYRSDKSSETVLGGRAT
jgi:hypothetical protein